jgi:hypothetical protein
VPPALDALVMRALSHDANLRYATALEMAEELATIVPLPTRTEVSAWVKQFVMPRPMTATASQPALADARTTIVAVLEKASQKLPSFKRTVVTNHSVATTRRRFPVRGAIAAAVTVALAVTGVGVAFAKAGQASSPTASVAASAGVIGDTGPMTAAEKPAQAATVSVPIITAEPTPAAKPVAPVSVPPVSVAPVFKATRGGALAPISAAADDAKSANCRPPYVVDALGHRHYKVECL